MPSLTTIILNHLRTHRTLILLFIAIILGRFAARVLGMGAISTFVEKLNEQAAITTLTLIVISCVLFSTVGSVFAGAATLVAETVQLRLTNSLRTFLFDQALRGDVSVVGNGELLEQIDADPDAIGLFISHGVVPFTSNFLYLLSLVAVLLWASIPAAILLLCFSFPALITLYLITRSGLKKRAVELDAKGKLFSKIEETLVASEELMANGCVEYALTRVDEDITRHGAAYGLSLSSSCVLNTATILFFAALQILFLAVCAAAVIKHSESVGQIVFILGLVLSIEVPLMQLVLQLRTMQAALASGGRIKDYYTPKAHRYLGDRILPAAPITVTAVDLVCRYGEHKVLEKISFTIKGGESLAVVGKTGSGKSTLAKVLLRHLEYQSGSIMVDGHDLREVCPLALATHFWGVAPLAAFPAVRIRDYVAVFDDQISDLAVSDALRRVGLLEWVSKFPEGVLAVPAVFPPSASQLLRLQFAQIFLRNPYFLVLDEPTARLDAQDVAEIQPIFTEVLKHRTTVVITHALHNIPLTHSVLELEKGQIKSFQGTAQCAGY